MLKRSVKLSILAALAALCAASPAANAQDFFSTFFGIFGGRPPRPPAVMRLPFANEVSPLPREEMHRHAADYDGDGQAYCVRTCDGRYFPISASDSQSRAASCHNFCPAAETKVVYGGNIDQAATESGELYSELPNAFRYRNELVADCTCNGKDQLGLASIKVENDPTLRQGDIVATKGGLMVAGRGGDRRGASLNFSPLPGKLRARFRHVPLVAAD